MQELIIAAGGLGLYFLARSAGHVVSIVTAVLLLGSGLVLTLIGWTLLSDSSLPRLACLLVRSWTLFLWSLGALVSWLAMNAVIALRATYGDKPTADAMTVIAAVVALIGLIITRWTKAADRYSVGWLVQWMIRDAFRKRVGPRPLGVSDEHPLLLAHRAVEDEAFATREGVVQGWAGAACCRRLRLIKAGLAAPRP
jgi:hypothetical protein